MFATKTQKAWMLGLALAGLAALVMADGAVAAAPAPAAAAALAASTDTKAEVELIRNGSRQKLEVTVGRLPKTIIK